MQNYKAKGFKSLGDIVPGLTQDALQDNGSVKVRLLTQWSSIVGNSIAEKCMPQEVKFSRGKIPVATLHLEVNGGFSTEIAMLEQVMLEKIAVYFGYRAIQQIKVHQAPKD